VEPVYVALGSNLGNRDAHLAFARAALAALPETTLLAVSQVEETEPLPLPSASTSGAGLPPTPSPQPRYLNQMALLQTSLAPRELLERLLGIEAAAGRVRVAGARWQPRTLDLDIVRYGERTVREPGLTLPHPELARRPFWHRGIAELEILAGQARHG
jgi:2-amino-4-hydroxy-6-hydroxymethyldihydropteridine diphosphokinase